MKIKQTLHRPELLAPAGSMEALVAAVQNGADAIYLGVTSFNARRSAKNFSEDTLEKAVQYCHLYGVKVYLTLNTLVHDREMPNLLQTASLANRLGIDAVLVQDWGVFDLLRHSFPDMPIHASTQMSLHTLSGLQEAAALGIQRVVVARELSREEIAFLCQFGKTEIEIFVHGALCMCYSGQCEMSAIIGKRSGNRGACAQPCRLPYGFHGKADGTPLSLKDMNLSSHIPELIKMGVACLKIEGRLKRPEYVAAVTRIYATLLRENRRPTQEEQKQLFDAFSRDGFTDGYYTGKTDHTMFGVRPKNAYVPEEWFSILRAEYEKGELRRIPLRFSCRIAQNEPITLEVFDQEGHQAIVQGHTPEIARSHSLERESLRKNLCKTGGTAFIVSDCKIFLEKGLAVSISAIDALRRSAIHAIEELRCSVPTRRSLIWSGEENDSLEPTVPPHLTVSLANAAQWSEALHHIQPDVLYFPLEQIHTLPSQAFQGKTHICAVLPRIYRSQDENGLSRLLRTAVELGVESAAIGNLGHFPLVRGLPLQLRGDFGLNVYNSASLRFLKKQGLYSATLSPELRMEQIRDLKKYLPCEAIVYGRTALMLTEHRLTSGNTPSCLTDRRGEKFPILPMSDGRSEIENAKPIFLADQEMFRTIGLSFARLRFTTESPEECVRMLRIYRGEISSGRVENFTRGLFFRSVE